jgi:hypothetical protein
MRGEFYTNEEIIQAAYRLAGAGPLGLPRWWHRVGNVPAA